MSNSNVSDRKAFTSRKIEANIDPRPVCVEVADSTMLVTFATNRQKVRQNNELHTKAVSWRKNPHLSTWVVEKIDY